MAQLQFTVISKGTGREKCHVVIYVGAAGEPEYCLVIVIGAKDGHVLVQDVKQASQDDLQNYLLEIFRKDTVTTTLSCTLAPGSLNSAALRQILVTLGNRVLGTPAGAQVDGLEKLSRYTATSEGKTAWGEVLQKVDVNRAVRPAVNAKQAAEEADMADLVGVSGPARKPAPAPADGGDDDDFNALLGGDTPAKPQIVPHEGEATVKLPKLQKISGAEGKLVFFTARYSKVLEEFSQAEKAAGHDMKKLTPAARKAAADMRKILKDVTAVPTDFFSAKALTDVHEDFGSIYVRQLHLNLPEFKEKSKSEIVRLLSMEITGSPKLETESITVQFLYKHRFDLPPEMGDHLRDLLRFFFGKPLALEESFSHIGRKVDLTKLYYKFTPPGAPATVVTDIFCFRELNGRSGLIYVPYDYLGTGAVNQLLIDFFGKPWAAPTAG